MLAVTEKHDSAAATLTAWLDLVRECLWNKASIRSLLALNLNYAQVRHDLAPEAAYILQVGLQEALDRHAQENPLPADIDLLLRLDPAADPAAFLEVQNAFSAWKTVAWGWHNLLMDLSRHLFRNTSALDIATHALSSSQPPALPPHPLSLKRKLRSIAFLEALLGESQLAASPQWLILDQNNVCNLKCKMCSLHAEGIKYAPAYFINLENLGSAVAWAGKITLGGTGEPLLHPGLAALLQHKLPETTVTINTNASLLRSRGDQLAGMDEIDISFDGDNPATFETLRTGAHFDALVEDIRNFCRQYPDKIITLNVVVSSINVDEIYGISALAISLGVRYVVLNPIYVHESMAFLRLRPEDDAKLREQFKRLETDFPGKITIVSNILPGDLSGETEKKRLAKETLLARLRETRLPEPVPTLSWEDILKRIPALSVFSWWPHPPSVKAEPPVLPTYEFPIAETLERELIGRLLSKNRIQFPYCLAPWMITYVHAQGTVRPCCFYPYTAEESLYEQSLLQLWNGPVYRDLRAAMLGQNELPAACRACTASMRQTYKDKLIPFAAQFGYQYNQEEDVLEFKPQIHFKP